MYRRRSLYSFLLMNLCTKLVPFQQRNIRQIWYFFKKCTIWLWNVFCLFILHLTKPNIWLNRIKQLLSPKCRIYVSVNWIITGSGNGSSPDRHQTISWTNAGLLSIGLLGKKFSEIWNRDFSFLFKKCIWKCRLTKWLPFCPGGDELKRLIACGYWDRKHD